MAEALVEYKNLHTYFETDRGVVKPSTVYPSGEGEGNGVCGGGIGLRQVGHCSFTVCA
jgi:hypothetical protein